MKITAPFDGWWMVLSTGQLFTGHYGRTVIQVFEGETYDREHCIGPFKELSTAESWRYRDWLASYWEAGMPVWADHCLGCGRWAKVLAFDDTAGWAWRVTECRKCGVLDSRMI